WRLRNASTRAAFRRLQLAIPWNKRRRHVDVNAMQSEHRSRRRAWLWVAPIVGVAALGFATYTYLHTPRERSYRLTMAAGSAASTRNQVAETLKPEMTL